MPVHGHRRVMPAFLAHVGKGCSCVKLLEDTETDDYYGASGRSLQFQGAYISRADVMAKASSATCAMQHIIQIPTKNPCPSNDTEFTSQVETVSPCPDEDASVLVQSCTSTTAKRANPAPACQQSAEAGEIVGTDGDVAAEPETPSCGASRAVSRTDSNSSVREEMEAVMTPACPSAAAAAVTVKGAVAVAVMVAAAFKAAAVMATVIVLPGVAAASAATAIMATDVVLAATVVRAHLLASNSSTYAISTVDAELLDEAQQTLEAGILDAAPLLTTASAAVKVAGQPNRQVIQSSTPTGGSSDDGGVRSSGLCLGNSSEQSTRAYQEDRAAGVVFTSKEHLNGYSQVAFAAVFDGGLEAAEHLQQQAIGDSRAVLCREGQAVQQTWEHKPTDEREKLRIMTADASAEISSDGYCCDMGVSRGLSSCKIKAHPDKKAFNAVTAAADGVTQQLHTTDDFVVLGSAGLFESLRNMKVVVTARSALAAGPGNCTAAAYALVQRAVCMGSSDNITAVVLMLHDRIMEATTSLSRLFRNRAAPCSRQ